METKPSNKVCLPVRTDNGTQDMYFDESFIRQATIRPWEQKRNQTSASEDWSVMCRGLKKEDDYFVIPLTINKLLDKLKTLGIINIL